MGRSLPVALGTVCLLLACAPRASANGVLVTDEGGGTSPSRPPAVRLSDLRVSAVVSDRVAEVTVDQVFRSRAKRDLEGTYLFPLPRGAAVRRFAMTMGGQLVEGEILEAAKAKEVYERIVARRKDPGLLEWAGEGLFRARVFPIPAGGEVTVRLVYQEVLAEAAGTLEWRYPLSSDRLGGAPVERISVEARVESPVDLKAVYSPSHRIETVREGERVARVSYEASGTRETRDFLLYLGRGDDPVGFSLASTKPGGQDGTFMAVFSPRGPAVDRMQVPRDVVFVLDTSGSMEGDKIEKARAAVVHGLQTLAPCDRFAVLAFSTSVRPWRDGLAPATPEQVAAASEWARGLQAAGGTNIGDALPSALRMLTAERLPFVVFVTDGRPTVGETFAKPILARVAEANAAKARVFTFGVGWDLDVNLLDQIAESSGGARAYVQSGENLADATAAFFRKVARPVLADATVEFAGGAYDVYPARVGDLFAGEQVALFGRYREPGPVTLRVKGRAGDQPWETVCTGVLRADPGPEPLPRLWAHRKVAYLLDQIRLHGADKELVGEVTALAVEHRIVTPYTSGLVVEEGGRDDTEEVHASDAVAREPTIQDAESSDPTETDNDLPFEDSIGRSGQSDAPHEGPPSNGLIGIGPGIRAFQGRGGHRNLRAGGGDSRTADLVHAGLSWLLVHQSDDGSWTADGTPPSSASRDEDAVGRVEPTALAVLAFLAEGYTMRSESPFARSVGDGLRFLRNLQVPEGGFGFGRRRATPRADALATLALVEVFGMTRSPIYRHPSLHAVRGLHAARDAWLPDGPAPADDRLDACAWALLALRSAALVDDAHVRQGAPPWFAVEVGDVFDRVRAWLDATPEPDPSAQPLAVALRVLARRWTSSDQALDPKAVAAAAELTAGAPRDLSWPAAHWGTLAAFVARGDAWKAWETARLPALSRGASSGLDPSVAPFPDCEARAGPVGPVASVALGVRALRVRECSESYLPPRPPPLAAPLAPAPSSDADRVRESEDLRRRRDASSEGDLPPPR